MPRNSILNWDSKVLTRTRVLWYTDGKQANWGLTIGSSGHTILENRYLSLTTHSTENAMTQVELAQKLQGLPLVQIIALEALVDALLADPQPPPQLGDQLAQAE